MNITKFIRTFVAVSALFVGVMQTAKADIVTFTGDVTGDVTYHRPLESLTGLSGVGTDVGYDTLTFTTNVTGDYTFLSSASFDQIIYLYANAFNPAAPLTNAVIANDDLLNFRTSGFETTLTAGVTYFLVTAAFDNGDIGNYSVTIAGPGLVSAVPEPSTWLMLALGLAAITYAQRRKSQR